MKMKQTLSFRNEHEFSSRIAYHRHERKLSHEKFAELIGVSVGYAYKLEASSEKPSVELLAKIANLFQISTDDLILKENTAPQLHLNSAAKRLESLTPAQIISIMRSVEGTVQALRILKNAN